MPRSGCDRLREYDKCLFSLPTGGTCSPWFAFLSLSLYTFHQTEGNRTDMLAVSSLTIALASSAHSHAFWCEAVQSFVSAPYLQTDPVSEPGGHVWNCCVQTCCRRQRGCGCLRWPWWTPPPVKDTKLYSSHDGECVYKVFFCFVFTYILHAVRQALRDVFLPNKQ